MGNRANLNSIHIGHSHAWKSEWFGSVEYQTMLSQDYKIREYLSNIFFNFKLPVSEFNLKRYTNHLMYIDMDLYFPEDIKDKFYLFQNLEDQLYDCIDAIIYYLKNEFYLYNVSVSRGIQNMKLTHHKTLDASSMLFKNIFSINAFMCHPFSVYYATLHYKLIVQYFTYKTYGNFYNLLSRLLSNIFVSKASSIFANTTCNSSDNILARNFHSTNILYKLSYIFKLYVFLMLLQYNIVNPSIRFAKYIVTLSNVLKTIFHSLLDKELLILLLLQSHISRRNMFKIFSKNTLLKFFAKALPNYNLNYTNVGILLNDIIKSGKVYNNTNYIKVLSEFNKYINNPSFSVIYCLIFSHTLSENAYFLPYILKVLVYVKSIVYTYRQLTIEFTSILLISRCMPKVISVMFSYLTSIERSIYHLNKYNNLSLGTKLVSSIQVTSNLMHSVLAKVYNLLNIKWSIYKFEVIDDYFFRNIIFKQITYHIETTISKVLKLHCIFLPNLYIRDVIPFNSAKLISQYVAYELEKGSPVSEIFRDLKSIHVGDSYKRNEFFKRMYKFTHISTLGTETFKSYVSKLGMMNPFDVKNQERLDVINLSPLQFSQFYIQLLNKPVITSVLNLFNSTMSYLELSGLIYIIALSHNYNLYFKNSYMFDLRIASKLKQWYEFISVTCINELNSLRAKAPMMYLKKFPVQGVKIAASGTFKRGNEATVKWYSEGKMPRQTITIDVEQYVTPAFTRNGVIGINVSLFCNTDRFQDEIELKSEEFLDYFKLNKRHTSKYKGSMFNIRSKSKRVHDVSSKNDKTISKQRLTSKAVMSKSFVSRDRNRTGSIKPQLQKHPSPNILYKNQRFAQKFKSSKLK